MDSNTFNSSAAVGNPSYIKKDTVLMPEEIARIFGRYYSFEIDLDSAMGLEVSGYVVDWREKDGEKQVCLEEQGRKYWITLETLLKHG